MYKHIVYFSCLEGKVLKRLHELSDKNRSMCFLNNLVTNWSITPYFRSYAYFLINLYDLADKYNKTF